MARSAELVVKILTDASGATAGINDAKSALGGFESAMGSLVGPATAVAAGVTAIGVASVNAASDVQQAMGGLDAVFGKNAEQVKKWARGAADSVGLSTAQYGNFAATIGAQLKNLGVPFDQVAGKTDELIRLGADLAATYGGTTEQAVQALGSAMRGEADPAERYGLALNQTKINAELAAQGLDTLEGEALTAAKAQAIMGLATEQAGDALGQYGREQDTVAGQTQKMTATWADATAALGEALLPAVTAAAAALGDMGKFIKENASWITPLIAGIGALAAAILVINGAMAAYKAVLAAQEIATLIATAAQWAFNAALTANPIGIIIAAVGALVAAFIYLWNTNEDFRNFFIGLWEGISAFFQAVWQSWVTTVETVVSWFTTAWDAVAKFFTDAWNTAVLLVQVGVLTLVTIWRTAFNTIKTVVDNVVSFFTDAWNNAVNAVVASIRFMQGIFTNVFNAIMVPINAVVGAFNAVIDAVQSVIKWISKIKIPDVFGAIGNLVGGRSATLMVAPAVSSYSGPGVGSLAYRTTAAASGGTVININGGLDSADAIARRIQQVLQQRDRRTGGINIARSTR